MYILKPHRKQRKTNTQLKRLRRSESSGNKKLDRILCVVSTGVASSWEAIYDNVVGFLEAQGRMKFVRPLYRNLYRTGTTALVQCPLQHPPTHAPPTGEG